MLFKSLFHLICSFVFIISCADAQKKNTEWHPIVQQAKETSYFAGQVNWQEVNEQFTKLTSHAQNSEDLTVGLQYLINSLGDKHAAIRSTHDYSILLSYQGASSDIDPRNPDFVNSVINDISVEFSYELLDYDVGYLRVVGIGPGDVKKQADQIRHGLITLAEQGVKHWILDLRYNGGGNIEPMIAGLATLLGEGPIGGAVDSRSTLVREYTVADGTFNNNGRVVCEMDNLPEGIAAHKVAVLLSRYTASSGELLAIAFKGRPNTTFIGERTAGYTTGNGYDVIHDDLALVISQDVFADRAGTIYKDKVSPDVISLFEHNTSLSGDTQIYAALNWLKD